MPDSGTTSLTFSLERYREYLSALAKSRVNPRLWAAVDPSGIAQETLLKAHAARDRFRGRTEAELAAWLRAILNNTLANALRDCGRRNVLDAVSLSDLSDCSSGLPGVEPPDTGLPPDELAVHNERLLRLAAALAELPGDQRVVVELKHLHGLALSEICERVGRTRGAVIGLLYRGVKAIRAVVVDPGSSVT